MPKTVSVACLSAALFTAVWFAGSPAGPPPVRARPSQPSSVSNRVGPFSASRSGERALIWGDSLCDGALDLADAIETLKIAAAITPRNNPPCPIRGAGIFIGGQPYHWGDNDCDVAVGALDALPIIAQFAGQPMQFPGCPAVGDQVILDD